MSTHYHTISTIITSTLLLPYLPTLMSNLEPTSPSTCILVFHHHHCYLHHQHHFLHYYQQCLQYFITQAVRTHILSYESSNFTSVYCIDSYRNYTKRLSSLKPQKANNMHKDQIHYQYKIQYHITTTNHKTSTCVNTSANTYTHTTTNTHMSSTFNSIGTYVGTAVT